MNVGWCWVCKNVIDRSIARGVLRFSFVCCTYCRVKKTGIGTYISWLHAPYDNLFRRKAQNLNSNWLAVSGIKQTP